MSRLSVDTLDLAGLWYSARKNNNGKIKQFLDNHVNGRHIPSLVSRGRAGVVDGRKISQKGLY